jgi:hypothetical protein
MHNERERQRYKDFDCFRLALKEFRERHGLEVYKAHVTLPRASYSYQIEDRPGFEDVIGSGHLVNKNSYSQPYREMVREFRNHRSAIKAIKDNLLAPKRKNACIEEARSQISRWSIGYRREDAEYASHGVRPGLTEKGNIVISPCRSNMLRDLPDVVDEKFILDLRNRESAGDHTTAEVVALVQKRHDGTTSRGYYLVEIRGHVAWLPDAIKESLAFGNSRERAVRTSRDRMIRFIDKRLKGESE